MITGVCISEREQSLALDIPFVSYTEGYRSMASRDSNDPSRISYLSDRYNSAIDYALKRYPDTEHLLVIDHYYLPFSKQVEFLIQDYLELDRTILGASIWYWAKRRIRPWIGYYDTLSAPEFKGKTWKRVRDLPTGVISVSAVGACWIFPRRVWERTDGFRIPSPPQAGSSRCLDTSGYRIMLDCNCRLWRTHETNPAIPNDHAVRRILNSVVHAKRKLVRVAFHR